MSAQAQWVIIAVLLFAGLATRIVAVRREGRCRRAWNWLSALRGKHSLPLAVAAAVLAAAVAVLAVAAYASYFRAAVNG